MSFVVSSIGAAPVGAEIVGASPAFAVTAGSEPAEAELFDPDELVVGVSDDDIEVTPEIMRPASASTREMMITGRRFFTPAPYLFPFASPALDSRSRPGFGSRVNGEM